MKIALAVLHDLGVSLRWHSSKLRVGGGGGVQQLILDRCVPPRVLNPDPV